jgi:hypothetical protein
MGDPDRRRAAGTDAASSSAPRASSDGRFRPHDIRSRATFAARSRRALHAIDAMRERVASDGTSAANRFVMRTALASALALSAILVAVGCSSATQAPRTVHLLSTAGIPFTQTPSEATPLEVVTRSTAVRDPLPVHGADVAYGDMEAALGFAVSSATVPWANAHKQERPEGWQIFVEVTQADAEYVGGRLVISLSVRATLRTRRGHFYLAQTQVASRQGGVIDADRGGAVVYACMMRIGRDLADWLGGVEA